jgi:hypothetical protein
VDDGVVKLTSATRYQRVNELSLLFENVTFAAVKPGMYASVSNDRTAEGPVARYVYFAPSKSVIDAAWAKRREAQAATRQTAAPSAPATQPAVRDDPTVGVPKRPGATTQSITSAQIFMDLHQQFLNRARQGNVDVLFLGDSITRGWAGRGKTVWEQRYEPLLAANFGIGGDRTQHVIWRAGRHQPQGRCHHDRHKQQRERQRRIDRRRGNEDCHACPHQAPELEGAAAGRLPADACQRGSARCHD